MTDAKHLAVAVVDGQTVITPAPPPPSETGRGCCAPDRLFTPIATLRGQLALPEARPMTTLENAGAALQDAQQSLASRDVDGLIADCTRALVWACEAKVGAEGAYQAAVAAVRATDKLAMGTSASA